jgi:enamine deaminase RidA (YjgF/YER057c/UK114 family)
MRLSITDWLGWEFIEIGLEAPGGGNATEQARAMFSACSDTLSALGLSLDDTVRSRLWAVDRASRDAGSDIRFEALSGKARSASSSYICPSHFASDALVGIDVIAVRPQTGTEKLVRENDPLRVPCRYITQGSLIVLSGQTVVLPDLEIQVITDILPRITGYLGEANSGWERVANVSCYMHRSQSPDEMRALFKRMVPVAVPRFEICLVDGYSAEGKLVEIEVTAERGA